jgi:putative ABC transport system substrate-binding protein
LLSFGPKEGEGQIAAATIVHKILQGAPPADIPVVQQRVFTLVVNARTAADLGISLPAALLRRADEQL